jgi:hypothetical protein
MDLDWRIQAATTTVTDIPAAYPGGPSHPAGSIVVLVSQVVPPEGPPIAFPAPSATAIALGVACRAARAASVLRTQLRFGPAVAPEGQVLSLDRSVTSQLFDYFEQCFVTAVFSIQALEAYCNYKISQSLLSDYTVERRGKTVVLSPPEVERELSIDEKLGTLLPDLLSVPTPRGRKEWEAYVNIRRVRDATIHLKSHHQWTSSEKFEESPYSWFIQQSVLAAPRAAIEMLRYFAAPHERPWTDEAEKLLNG